jgi:hypothetical protein
MKIKLIGILLAFSLLFSSSANASFFNSASQITEELIMLVKKLSDDIGDMADRISDMADKIGDMADRIVHTEEIMANLVQELETGNRSTATSDTTVIISSDFQTLLSPNDIPSFTTNINAKNMLIFISSTRAMNTNTINVLVKNNAELAQKWSDLNSLAIHNKIYIAIKVINDNSISSLSNVLEYTTTY